MLDIKMKLKWLVMGINLVHVHVFIPKVTIE